MEIKGLVVLMANHLALLDAYAFLRRKLTKSQVAILIYHRICPRQDNWSIGTLSPDAFESQIRYFCRSWEVLSLEKLAQYIHHGKSLPEKALVVTLDDGYKDNYLHAYPILKKYHAPATIFLTTGHIGTGKLFWWDKVGYAIQYTTASQLDLGELGRYSLTAEFDRSHIILMLKEALQKLSDERKSFLIEKLLSIASVNVPPHLAEEIILSWDEVREMSNDGINFGAHSVNHPILTQLPLEHARWEIIQSKKDIEEKLGHPVTAFSYPNGEFSPRVIEFVKESGFTCAVSVLPSKLITYKDDPYELSRITPIKDFNRFKAMLCGLGEDLQHRLSRL